MAISLLQLLAHLKGSQKHYTSAAHVISAGECHIFSGLAGFSLILFPVLCPMHALVCSVKRAVSLRCSQQLLICHSIRFGEGLVETADSGYCLCESISGAYELMGSHPPGTLQQEGGCLKMPSSVEQ